MSDGGDGGNEESTENRMMQQEESDKSTSSTSTTTESEYAQNSAYFVLFSTLLSLVLILSKLLQDRPVLASILPEAGMIDCRRRVWRRDSLDDDCR
jgi:hypothetical protein